MTTRAELADFLFPQVKESIDDLLAKYPPRPEGKVLRFAPSPTGYLHFGHLYTSFVGRKHARQNNGVFFLRIEDTDQKREVAGATQVLLKILKKF